MFGGFGRKEESAGDKALAMSKTTAADKGSALTAPPSGGDSGARSVHGFDPSALERAAKAAKELDSSKSSRDALNLISNQEVTRQKEHEMERAKYLAMKEELAIRRVQEEEQANARNLDKQTQHEKARTDYKDQLERKRMVDQINAQRHLQEEERKKAEESLRRQEEIRRKTLEYEAELRQQTEMARVKAETDGRIMQERKNHDLTLENKRLEAKEYRETVLESIKLAGSTVGAGIKEFVSDREKLGNVAVTLSLIALGIYGAKVGTGVTGRYVEARLGKPALVRETTRKNALQMLKSPISSLRLAFGSKSGESALKNIVLPNNLESRLKRVAVSTCNTKKNNAPFRHLLLHGPPGTGKTLFAKGLARESGLHYAIMTGGDIAPLGKDAVSEIHKLFDWANSTNKGVILFVDEADAFLRKRSTEHISEDMRNALNAFLYRTGEASRKFMIVYASNQPDQFDWAINDRIDEIVRFNIPGYDERLRMISLYMDTYLLNPPQGSKRITTVGVDEELIKYFARETEGYSGREISKLAIAWQAAAYGTENATIDVDLLNLVLEESKNSKAQKQTWLGKAEIENLVSDSIKGGSSDSIPDAHVTPK
jgi:ATPase family AAA domain-containing protein 3A/B